MPNTYVNHVVVDGVTKLDLREDTATAADVALGKSFHLASGEATTGTASLQTKSATPTEQTQVIEADSGSFGLSSVTVNPIPTNYGRVTWNGSVLTIS